MIRIQDDENFRSLSRDQWEDLCCQLLLAEGRRVNKIDGSGGDGGIDAYEGEIAAPSVIYQFKHFKDGLNSAQVTQVKRSLNKALERYSDFRWVLMTSADPTPASAKKLEELRAEHADLEIEMQYGSSIRQRVASRRSILRQFYANESDLMMEALDNDGKGDYAESFSRKARLLNEDVGDDRFRLEVASDGNENIVICHLQPWAKEPVSMMNVTAKTDEAARALMDLEERGIDIDLTGKDIDVAMLVDLGVVHEGAELQRIWTHHEPSSEESLLRLFPSEDGDASSVLVALRTERSGSKEIVRSNSNQAGCPLLVTFTFHETEAAGEKVAGRMGVQIRPNYVGCTLSKAIRGARFLVELNNSKRLGLGDADSDGSDASFNDLEGFSAEVASEQLATLLEIKEVYDFFGMNPVLTDEVAEEDFGRAVIFLAHAIRRSKSGPWTGDISGQIESSDGELESIDWPGEDKGLMFVTDMGLDAFGCPLRARIQTETQNAQPRIEKNSDGSRKICIAGTHTISVTALADTEKCIPMT